MRKNIFKLIKAALAFTALATMLVLAGCGSDNEKSSAKKESAPPPDPTINVQLDYKIEPEGGNQYKVSGTTNLPDGIELMVELDNRNQIVAQAGYPEDTAGDKLPDDLLIKIANTAYTGSDKPAVKNGKFESTFSGENLKPGEYYLTFSTPLWRIMKNEDVKKKLGEGCKYLEGKGVVDSDMKDGGKVIRIREKVNLQ